MTEMIDRIRKLIDDKDILISEHSYDELADDDISVREVVAGVGKAVVVENYPEYPKGSCVLVLQRDKNGESIHVVWGIQGRVISCRFSNSISPRCV